MDDALARSIGGALLNGLDAWCMNQRPRKKLNLRLRSLGRERMSASEIARVFRWGLLGVVLIAALVIGGWQAGWWFTSHNVSRQAQVDQQGYGNQSAMREEISNKILDVQRYTVQIKNPAFAGEKSGIEQSRAYAAQLACGDAAQLNQGTVLAEDVTAWLKTNCQYGQLSPTSIYNVSTTPGE